MSKAIQGQDVRPEMPNGIHIVVVVYGATFAKLLAEITLPNLAAMVREIPDDLRTRSVLRILTTAADRGIIEASMALPTIRKYLRVEVLESLEMDGFETHGGYGPMVVTQRQAVLAAAHAGAAIFFVGPDQIYSRGSFANFIDRLKQGYRVIVGPGVRICRDAARPFLRERIAASADGSLSLSSQEQADLFFRYWHPINDQFILSSPAGILWKAYLYYRPHPDELLIRFFQGPTLVAWPRSIEGFNGFIDHALVQHCCHSWREVYVVADSKTALALDLTDDARRDVQSVAKFPRTDFLRELFDHRAINDMQLLYGLRTCRVHRSESSPDKVADWSDKFARSVDPVIFLALVERLISRRLGSGVARIYRIFVLLNANSLSVLLGFFARRWLRRWRPMAPPNS
jgi:hypothetical protein